MSKTHNHYYKGKTTTSTQTRTIISITINQELLIIRIVPTWRMWTIISITTRTYSANSNSRTSMAGFDDDGDHCIINFIIISIIFPN